MSDPTAHPLHHHHGTAQSGRLTDALLPDHVSVDERTLPDLLAYAAAYAAKVRFHDHTDQQLRAEETEQNWAVFFDKDETVFLATLLTTDIHKEDEDVQAGFMKIHQLRGREEQVENFRQLVESLLAGTKRLFTWYDSVRDLRGSNTLTQIAREIDRAMEGELGYQLSVFTQISQRLSGSNSFPEAEGWQQQLAAWAKPWPRKKEDHLAGFPENTAANLLPTLNAAGSLLQDYYRRLYFTLAYLGEIAPDLFDRSIREKHDHDPDIGLLIAFLQLFAHAQEQLNRFTGRHLAYYHEEVLGRKPLPGVPDRAVIGFQSGLLREGIVIEEGTRLLAGTDREGIPAYYETAERLYVSMAKVAALRTLFVSRNPLVSTNSSYQLVTAVYAAPMANSADGMGEAFSGTDHGWPVLGEDQFDVGPDERQMSAATMGFAVASSILQLSDGERRVTVRLRFTPASFAVLNDLLEDIAENTSADTRAGDVFSSIFNRPFRLFLTGEEGWLPVERYAVEPAGEDGGSGSSLTLRFILPSSAASVTGYDEGVHGGGFQTPWPLLKIILSDAEPTYAYSFLRDLELEEIGLEVNVSGVRNLSVHNDLGLLDASRPFVPFGPLPRKGSYMLIGHPELFSKQLTALDIGIEWAELPDGEDGFAGHYRDYGQDITNESFQFSLSALSDYAFRPERREERENFPLFTTDPASPAALLERTDLQLDATALKKLHLRPIPGQVELEDFSSTARSGYLRLELAGPKMGFGHLLYPRIFTRQIVENARPRPFSLLADEPEFPELPQEPYTPVISHLNLGYTAETTINLRRTELKENNAVTDDRLFRLHPFGTETVYAGGDLRTPYLLPRFDEDGYLFIGLQDLHPGHLLSLHFDLADSSKRFNQQPLDLKWHYLRNEEWHPLAPDQVISDTTVMFSTRGVVRLQCPADMSKGGGLMDAGMYWLRVAASGNMDITGRCTTVVPHVAEVVWVDQGDTAHLTTPPHLRPRISGPAGNIPGLTGIVQLGEFYGGRPAETETDFYVRGSERLRHKNRAVSLWDYEHLILERFPDIRQVKCIGRHDSEEGAGVIGQVLIVVVPASKGGDITPRVGYHVLDEIAGFLQSRCGPFVHFRVINPTYEPVKVNCSVKLHPHSNHQQGMVWRQLHTAIREFICPWLAGGEIQLGGNVNKTEILALFGENPNVAFATAFSMIHVYEPTDDHLEIRDTALPENDSEIISPSQPWSVLVPVFEQAIGFLTEDEYRQAEVTAIEGMQLGADFIISEKEETSFDLSSGTSTTEKDQYVELPPGWLGL